MTSALLTEAASPATLAKEKAFRNVIVKAREQLARGYEAEAIRELDAALRVANDNIKTRIARAYAAGEPEDWSYAKILANGRLEDLQRQLDAEIAYLNNGAREITDRYATYAFLRDAEKTADLLAGVGLPPVGAALDMATVATFVNFPIDGVVFGERFAAMTAAMQAEAHKAMTAGLVAGDGVAPITRSVLAVTDLNRAAAETVVRTTMMNASNQAHAYTYEKAGVEELEIDAALDSATCPACLARDGKRISVKDAASISLHPECFIDGQTPIFTVAGWKPISDIAVGDLVLTHKGRFRPVTVTIRTPGQKPDVVQFWFRTKKPNRETTLTVTVDHPILINDEWHGAGDVKVGDEIGLIGDRVCEECGRLIPLKLGEPLRFCSRHCFSLNTTRRQWADPKHRELVSQKNKANMLEQYKNGRPVNVANANDVTRRLARDGMHVFQKPEVRAKGAKMLGLRNYGQSVVEKTFMAYLRNKLGLNPIGQYRIETGKRIDGRPKYRFIDYAFPAVRLGVECDGGPWHDADADLIRDGELKAVGWDILHIPATEIQDDIAASGSKVVRMLANHSGDYRPTTERVLGVKRWTVRKARMLYNLSVHEDESYIAKGFIVHNCRCVGRPVVKDWPEGPRRGKEYEKGRATSKIFPADMTGQDYLKSLPREQQIQVLGVNRVRLVDDGVVNYADLWDRSGELTLLKDLDVPADFTWSGARPH